jgi:nucleoside-diphosphate-sugar epimerase
MYGPGPASADYIAAVRAREVPIIGNGDNYVSSIHSADVATALLAGLTAPAGTYNVADDEPMTAAEVVNSLSQELGVARPSHVPEVEARQALKGLTDLLTISQRVANNTFKETTGWAPRLASVIDGWADVVGRT